MSDDLVFDTGFVVTPDRCVRLSPLVRRLVANNPGPVTFTGTCSYIVGHGEVAVIDPGPELPEHVDALLGAVKGEAVTHILVSHTHKDHSPAARLLQQATGAPIIGCAPHHGARPLAEGEVNLLESSADKAYVPDRELREGEGIAGPGWQLSALATPGHMANHLAFALPEEKALFSADHVMAWSTSVVAPPDGSMRDYMASLEKLRGREETVYWPGHGGPVREPQRFVRGLINHRRHREASILNRLVMGDRTIPAIVTALYPNLDAALIGAASLSVFAHLEDLIGRGLAVTDGEPMLNGEYRPG